MNHGLRSGIAAGLGALLLAACSTLHTKPAPKPAVNPARATAPAAPYPSVALNSRLLYDVLLGEIAGEQGHTGVSSQYLGRATQATQDPRLAQRTAEIALYGKHYHQALRAINVWLKADPNSLEAQESQAQALLGLGRTQQAQGALMRVLALTPPSALPDTWLGIASLLARQPATDHTAALMHKLVQQHPKSAHGWFALSQLDAERNHEHAALQDIDQALQLRPAWEDAAVFKGRLLMLAGHAQAAATFYRQFLNTYPQATDLRLNYARYLVNVRDWSGALVQFRRVAAELPDDAQVNYATGLLALQIGRYAEAAHYLSRTVALQPGNHEAQINLGEAAQAQGNSARALYWYNRAAQGDTRFAAELHIGMLFAHEQHWAEAEARLQSVAPKTHAEKLEQALALDEVRSGQKHYHRALAGLDNALNDLPDNTRLLYARALVELKLGMIPEHERDLRAIIHQDPQNAQALNALGYTLTNHSTHYHEARILIGRALRLKPGDPYIMDSMGWAYYRLGHLKRATRYLREALAKRFNAQISAHLGEVLWQRGLHQEAKQVWAHALKKSPQSHSLKKVTQKFMH